MNRIYIERVFIFAIYIAIIFSSYQLFRIKNLVQYMRIQNVALNKQIIKEENSITLLKTNLSFLTKPDQLKVFAAKYLKLTDITLAQIIQEDSKTNNLQERLAVYKNTANKKSQKWRYKESKQFSENIAAQEKPQKQKNKNTE
ncbi:MAG: hypothetical protein K9G11_04295 [Rickettsiaceae bacterium]|nr:hypothetical protein [Rickettsiaceae bacterium]